MKSQIQGVLKKLDIFGQSISFNFRKEDVYRTSFGGFMSLAIIGLIVSFFYSNIISFFAMTELTATQQMIFEVNPPQVNLTNKRFMFAMQIEQTNYTTNPYFNITLEQRQSNCLFRHYHTFPNGTQIRYPNVYIDLVPCTIDHFQPIFTPYNMNITDEFKKDGLNNFLCPPINQTDLIIGGAWTSTDYYFLKISILDCQDSSTSNFTWQPKCKTKSQIQSQGNFRFQLYSVNYIFNPQLPEGDIQPYIANDLFFVFVPGTMFTQADIFFRKRSVLTDTGILMVPNVLQTDLASRDIGDHREQIAINQLTPGYYGAFYPQISPFSYQYNRQYYRLDQLLSYLGGFLQFVIVVVGIVVSFYNKQHLIVSMANDLYEFQLSKQEKDQTEIMSQLLFQSAKGRQTLKNSQKKTETIPNIKSISAFSSKPLMQQSIILSKDKDTKLNSPITSMEVPKSSPRRLTMMKLKTTTALYYDKFKKFLDRSLNIGISFRYIISEALDREDFLDDKSLLLRKATQQIMKELDVSFILKQLYEIEKLKQVLFYKEQQALFNFSQKPLITLFTTKGKRRSTKMMSLYRRDEELLDINQKKYNDIVNAYRTITALQSDNMTEEQLRFNTRLISLLGQELPFIIESEIAQYKGEGSSNDSAVEIPNDDFAIFILQHLLTQELAQQIFKFQDFLQYLYQGNHLQFFIHLIQFQILELFYQIFNRAFQADSYQGSICIAFSKQAFASQTLLRSIKQSPLLQYGYLLFGFSQSTFSNYSKLSYNIKNIVIIGIRISRINFNRHFKCLDAFFKLFKLTMGVSFKIDCQIIIWLLGQGAICQ
ncbi:hypothetical protein pb186bvf_016832 [Paramecium bursaria]